MPKLLSDAAITELTLVFAKKDGVEWAPRNGNARVLAVKGAPKSGFLGKLTESLKAYFAPEYEAGQYPVSENVADDIDNDGDGAEDYNQIVFALCQVVGDIQSCYWINDDGTRSIAIKTAIDSFLEQLDAFRKGGDAEEKAGARHSKADAERIAKIGDHLAAAKKALDDAQATHAELAPASDAEKKAGESEPQGAPPVADAPEVVVAPTDAASAPESAAIDAPAEPAAEQPTDKAATAEESDMTAEQIEALVASAATKAAEAAVAATTAVLQPQIDAAKAAADAATADAAASKAAAAALGAVARQPSAKAATAEPAAPEESRLQRAIKAALIENPDSPRI